MNTNKELFGHPRGLYVLFMTEMWERFSFYGTRAILILYMVASPDAGGLGWSTAKAGSIYGLYTGSAYFVGVFGGWVADNFLGARRSVVVGGVLIAMGNALCALGPEALLYAGLTLMAIGTGLLKPNASTMVGALYDEKDKRRDAGYSVFYMGINTGATLAPFICGPLAQNINWRLGFWAACVGMILGIVQYLLQQSQLGDAGIKVIKPKKARAAALVAPFDSRQLLRIGAIGVFFVFSAIFWAAFEQAGSSLNLFAENLTRNEVFGIAFPSSVLQSVNAFFVIALAPVITAIWLKLGPREPSSPIKFAIGLLGASAGFWVVAYAASLTGGGRVSVNWLLLVYLFHSVGELCLSPVGLSITTKLAPPRVAGLMMGVWFASIGTGNYLAGRISGSFKADANTLVPLFGWVAAVTLGAAIVLVMLTPFVKRLMGDVK